MFKKMKGISSYSKPFYGVGLYQNANSSFKHLALMQDYRELQKEAHVIRNKLDAAKQRKLMLAAEVWFLRRRYKWLLKTESLNSSQEQQIEQPLNLANQTKNEELFCSRMGTTVRKLPSIPDTKSNGKLSIGKQSSRHSASLFNNLKREQVLHGGNEASHPISTLVSDKNNRGGIKCGKETLMQCAIPSFDLNQKERIYRANNVGLRNSTVAFDLNQDSDLSRKEACMPSRTPFFDLNEISTGDEDFQTNFKPSKFEEAKMGLIRAVEDDQNDLKLSLCRNAGEGSSLVGKRKLSWQDSVALSF
ncbi:uncharacterized protein LOC111381985 isoform X1 [Olea europaea var. sylvestris]|uniref:uncharacterized protein LOC111381985 isoform X1 n=2 Tax=Olea europaea var. sylvestris TaxID=158386 RepID=UPI000C1D2752|nr:uncharacterized protein LOC111381985 isoform X1 [Olea europaea var. sylvestris]